MMGTNPCTILLVTDEENIKIQCQPGTTLMNALKSQGVYIDAPCGGKGLCGKCKVLVQGNGASEPAEEEIRHIAPGERAKGMRLACKVKVIGDMEVRLPDIPRQAQIMTGGMDYSVNLSPVAVKRTVTLDRPTIHDQRDDFRRLTDAIDKKPRSISLDVLRKLPHLMKDHDELTVVYSDKEILNVEKGNDETASFGIAVDIGTTTVVTYLMDLATGKQLDVFSELNAQKAFGGDVISRISHCMDHAQGLEELQKTIVKQIDGMVGKLIQRNHLNGSDILCMALAGNTTMMHLLAGLDPSRISVSPFIPAVTDAIECQAGELGFEFNKLCKTVLLPSISGYIGADITAGMLSSGMYRSDALCLLLDIGTNGEIALGNKDRIVCCSTAAGPAFEGAQIRHGVGGVIGAINTVRYVDGTLLYTTIAGAKPIGICGSGVVDAIAVLLDLGIIDETGRFVDPEELMPETSALADRVVETDGMPSFVIARAHETENGEPIVITQKDVREIQLAKAAISAGIHILVKSLGIKMEEVGYVYLAGGFGSYIDKRNAAKIGLIPQKLEKKVHAIGNAAGTGAMMALLSRESREDCERIVKKAEYIELSALPGFQDELVEHMYFE